VTVPAAAASRIGIVSDRRRLAAAAGRDLADAPALLVAQLEVAAEAGVAFYQLREPDLDVTTLLALARRLVAAAAGRTRVIVNDRADVAALAGAGVHLKHHSIDAGRLRPWLPTTTWISQAVHTIDDVHAAGPVDALVAGTAAPSVSKAAGTPTLGPAGLAALVGASAVPTFAIGGLTPPDWRWVAASGAYGIAAIGAFLPRRGEDPGAATARAIAAFAAEID
jgi:thiamine-phosphate diphosphorylase